MSRIQDILSRAERDGTVRRTRSLTDDYPARPMPDESIRTRAFVDAVPPADEARPTRPLVGSPAAGAAVAEPERLARAPYAGSGSAGASVAPEGEAVISPHDGYLGEHASPMLTGAAGSASGQLDRFLIAALAPSSLAAEQYRALRMRLKRAENGRVLRTIAITSPAKGDGKSVTAANLALTMAREFQQRVLLLDADLRRPSVHRLFGISDAPGLSDVLMDAVELDDALVTLPEHHLTLLPAGVPPGNPAELLGSTPMRRVLDMLRARFDRIIIDVPPVDPLADLHILAPMLDGLLMIVRAGITPKPAIERALSALDSSKVLGLVLNESGDEGRGTGSDEGYGYIAG